MFAHAFLCPFSISTISSRLLEPIQLLLVEGELHPGHFASPLENQTITLSHLGSNLESFMNPVTMFLACGRKLEWLEKTNRRACKLHTETMDLNCMWGESDNHHSKSLTIRYKSRYACHDTLNTPKLYQRRYINCMTLLTPHSTLRPFSSQQMLEEFWTKFLQWLF